MRNILLKCIPLAAILAGISLVQAAPILSEIDNTFSQNYIVEYTLPTGGKKTIVSGKLEQLSKFKIPEAPNSIVITTWTKDKKQKMAEQYLYRKDGWTVLSAIRPIKADRVGIRIETNGNIGIKTIN